MPHTLPVPAHRVPLFVLLLCCSLFLGCTAKKPVLMPPQKIFPTTPPSSLGKSFAQTQNSTKKALFSKTTGGWGYGTTDVFVFAGKPGKGYVNTIPQENALVALRNEVEFIQTPAAGERYVVIDYGPITRTVALRGEKMLAAWRLNLFVVSEKLHPALYAAALKLPVEKRLTGAARAVARTVQREYWFDVTNTFNAKPHKPATASKTP